ncbi:MAG: hypothetical protein HOO06_01360 [Bdellovibrionaceae bacterium]|jgi:hypothetical protein|nr:hypothetical protein [Pseudobdellovibrionaceae bacterium]
MNDSYTKKIIIYFIILLSGPIYSVTMPSIVPHNSAKKMCVSLFSAQPSKNINSMQAKLSSFLKKILKVRESEEIENIDNIDYDKIDSALSLIAKGIDNVLSGETGPLLFGALTINSFAVKSVVDQYLNKSKNATIEELRQFQKSFEQLKSSAERNVNGSHPDTMLAIETALLNVRGKINGTDKFGEVKLHKTDFSAETVMRLISYENPEVLTTAIVKFSNGLNKQLRNKDLNYEEKRSLLLQISFSRLNNFKLNEETKSNLIAANQISKFYAEMQLMAAQHLVELSRNNNDPIALTAAFLALFSSRMSIGTTSLLKDEVTILLLNQNFDFTMASAKDAILYITSSESQLGLRKMDVEEFMDDMVEVIAEVKSIERGMSEPPERYSTEALGRERIAMLVKKQLQNASKPNPN